MVEEPSSSRPFQKSKLKRASSARRSASVILAAGAHGTNFICQGYWGCFSENSSPMDGRIAPVRLSLYSGGDGGEEEAGVTK